MTMFDRLGVLLDRRRVLAYAAMLLAAEIAVSGYFVAATHGLLRPNTAPVTTDFVSFYAAGALANAGTPQLAYHPAEHFAAEQQAREPGIEYNYFYYPPVFLLLCALLARLPYIAAYLTFEGLTASLYLWVMTRILDDAGWAVIIAVLAFPVVFWNFGWGQNGFLTAALFGAGTLFLERRPVLAGICFGTLCYKPHFGLLIPIALAGGRHWCAFAAAAASSLGLIALSFAVFGAPTWHDFLASAMASPTTYETGGAKFTAFVTPFGAAMLVGGNLAFAYAIQVVATVVTIGLVAFAWSRRLSLPVRASILASATLVALPLALFYDLLLAGVAAAWLCRSESKLLPAERLVIAACYLALVDPVEIACHSHVPIAAIAALAILAIAVGNMLREARASERHAPR
jgi:alpha-1,2-mannosyltransferase